MSFPIDRQDTHCRRSVFDRQQACSNLGASWFVIGGSFASFMDKLEYVVHMAFVQVATHLEPHFISPLEILSEVLMRVVEFLREILRACFPIPFVLAFTFTNIMTDTIQISATMVNDLRSRTGAGLMDCKKALIEAQGNMEIAADLLRKKGLASAAKRADRNAKDGLVTTFISPDNKQGVIAIVSCETDFVAKTDDFKNFAKSLAEHIATNKPANLEALNAQTFKPTGMSVKDSLMALFSKLGEKMEVRHFATYFGDDAAPRYVEQYIHLGGKVGVMLSLEAKNQATYANAAFKTMAKDICMHIAASNPTAVNRSEVAADLVAKEKEIATEQAKGKPAAALEKIINGKLEKFYAQICLLEQPFVKNPDQSIKALVENVSKQVGDTITVLSFTRMQVGA